MKKQSKKSLQQFEDQKLGIVKSAKVKGGDDIIVVDDLIMG